MSKRALIVVGTDLSTPGNRAAAYAVGLAARVGARLLMVHVFDGFYSLPRELVRPQGPNEVAVRQGERLAKLRKLAGTLARPGVPIECMAVHGTAQEELPRIAEARRAQLLVLGSHGHGVDNRYFLESVADCVARCSPAPVLIVRGQPKPWTSDVARPAAPSLAGS